MLGLFRMGVIVLGLIASVAEAEISDYPPGFVESAVTDPVSGLAVHIMISRRADAPWLVLIHGLGQSAAKDWLPVLPALAERYQLLLFDLPGFGESARPDTALTPKKYSELVHWLVTKNAHEPVFVVGHSLGGAIALRYSHDYPDEVMRLLLIDAAGMLQTSVFVRHLSKVPSQVEKAPMLDALVAKGSQLINHLSGRAQDWTADFARTMQTLAGSDIARDALYKDNSNINAALGLVNEDFTPLIRNIKTPVWMLWGEQDPIAPVRTGVALQWLLPNAQLDILPKVGHTPMEDAPAKTGDWILKSLRDPQPVPRTIAIGKQQGDGVCKDQVNQVFQGNWRSLRFEHCSYARIENATVGRLIVERSTVALVNVNIDAQEVAIEASEANITATGLRISAPQALSVHDSRLDLAAVSVNSAQLGQQKGGSQFFMSLGHWCDGANEWRLHGVLKPQDGKLDQQFRKTSDGGCTLEAANVLNAK
jgi:pimeloyl-ACP methyl ester carboxylesterase